MARISLIVNTSWNVFNFRLGLLTALEKAGHEISVIAPPDEYVSRIPFPHQPVDIASSSLNPLTNLRIVWQLWRRLCCSKPDILLLYTIKPNVYGNIVARLLGIRTISNVAGLGSIFGKDNWLAAIVKILYRFSLSNADCIFFQNRDDLTLFVEQHLVPPGKTKLLPGSGVNVDRFDPAGYPPRDSHDRVVFLLAGRMLWEKGVDEYVQAARKVLSKGYKAEFRLLGFLDVDNPQAISKAEMESITSTGDITYLGTSDRMEEALSAVDCVVLPSKYREGTPRILLEAGAMAKIIITTNSPGCRDVVEDGVTGYLCEAANVDDLYEKMVKVIDSGSEAHSVMGKKSREHILNNFDENVVINSYLQEIESIMARRKAD